MAQADIFGIDYEGKDQTTAPTKMRGSKNDTSQVTQAEIDSAVRQAGEDLGVGTETLAYEAGVAGDYSTFNKMTPAEKAAFQQGRSDQQTEERKFGTSDNRQPYDAPPGTNWNLYNGVWNLYYRGRKVGDANGYSQEVIDLVDKNPSTSEDTGDGNGFSNGSLNTSNGLKTDAQIAAEAKAASDKAARQSAYDLLYLEFDRYGLGSLVTPLKDLITSGVSPSEFTLRLRETDAYKKRFAANESRIKNGLRALSEYEYITKEDAYQEVMRRRGLPESYYTRGDLGIQKGFESLIAGDVSSTELEDRIVTAQDRVLNANPEIAKTLKEFYPGISNGDILAYALDPANAINAIKRKITAAEIGTAAKQEGLTSGLSRADELAAMGVTKETAAQGYKTIGGGLQRGSQLASMYGENPYTQTSAEQEIFNLQGSQEARKQRQKITGLEQATFSGKTGITSGALARDRAGAY